MCLLNCFYSRSYGLILLIVLPLSTNLFANTGNTANGVAKRLIQNSLASKVNHKKAQGLLMRHAVLAAIKKHPMTHVGSAQKAIGKAYHDQADALFAGDPSYQLTYRTDQLDSRDGFREFEGSLDFPIWRSGQKNARHQLANHIVGQSQAELSYLKWQISGEVLERAWALKKAQLEVAQAGIQQQSAKRLEADVKRRVVAGEISRADLLLAQQSTSQAAFSYQQAIAETKIAQTAWETYTGYQQLPVDLHTLSRQRKLTEDRHPHTLVAKARISLARARLQNERKQRRNNPTLSIYAKRDRGINTDPFNNSLGVGISLPFGTRSSSAPRLAEASATVVEQVAMEAEIERKHQLEIRQARLAIKNARDALLLAKQQNHLAQRRWKLSKRAFQLGESDLFLVIRAREEADKQATVVKRNQLELGLLQARLNHILGATPL